MIVFGILDILADVFVLWILSSTRRLFTGGYNVIAWAMGTAPDAILVNRMLDEAVSILKEIAEMIIQNNYRLSIWSAVAQGLIYYFCPLLILGVLYGAIYGKVPIIVQGLLIALLYTAVFFLYFKLLFEVFQLKLTKGKTKAKHILLGLFTGVFCYIIGILVLQLIAYISPKLCAQTFEALDLMSKSYQLFIYMIIIGPIAEELLVRGFIFTGLKNRYGPTIALVLSSLIFAAIHLPLVAQSIYAFVLGCLLCFLYLKTGSIRACMLAHICNNGIYFLFGNLFLQ